MGGSSASHGGAASGQGKVGSVHVGNLGPRALSDFQILANCGPTATGALPSPLTLTSLRGASPLADATKQPRPTPTRPAGSSTADSSGLVVARRGCFVAATDWLLTMTGKAVGLVVGDDRRVTTR